MRTLPASSLGLERLVDAWNLAYAGYFVPMSWDVAQLQRHLRAGSVDLDRSLVWLDGEEPIALSLLGVRGSAAAAESEHSTVGVVSSAHNPSLHPGGERGWIGGFGVAPSHRGRGLSAQLMRAHLEALRVHGPRQVQLEVLTPNWARRTYERAGFATTRRLLVLQGELVGQGATADTSWADPDQVPDLVGQLGRLHAAYAPAWGREAVGVLEDPDGLRCLVLGPVAALDAVALVREEAGSVRVVEAVACDAASAGALAGGLARAYPGRDFRIVNEPEGSPLADAFARAGLAEVMAQYEMHWHA